MSARSLGVAFAAFALLVLSAARATAQGPIPAATPAAAPSAPSPTTPELSPPPDLSAFLGHPITRIDVVLDDDTWPDVTAPAVRTVRPGLNLTPGLARQLLDELLESGQFARARVSAVEDPGGARAGSTGTLPPSESVGVRLVAHLVPRKIIESLRVDMHGALVEEDELLRAGNLANGGELVGKDIPDQETRIAALFASRGFPDAVVHITTRPTDSPLRVTVIVDIVPGPPFALTHRTFSVSGAEPRAVARATSSYAVRPGDRMDQAKLEAADASLGSRLHALGYHRATVTHDLSVAGKVSTLNVRIDAGPLFVPRYEGNVHYDADALGAALGLEDESDRSPLHLAQKIKTFYVKHGFYDVEVSFEQRGPSEGGRGSVIELVFHIVEHPRVAVSARLYPCLKVDEIRHVQDAPSSAPGIGTEIDSFLEEELPGQDVLKDPDPQGLDVVLRGPTDLPRGEVPVPIDLDPDATFDPDTYERAVLHVQELYRNAGYLHAQAGPVQIVRRRCDPRYPETACVPLPLPHAPLDACTYDATNLPLPVAPADPAMTCIPDPGRGLACEPRLALRIPVKLGPRSILYDLAFYGARAIAQKTLAAATGLTLGDPANVLKLEEARRRILSAYKEEGFAYADVKYTLDSSLDHTRTRARFDIVEGRKVIVRQIILRGNERTEDRVIKKRIALEVGKPYRESLVRKTQERVATLNVFTSVNVTLEDAYVPQENKAVIVTVVEREPQYIQVQPGLSTGEGLRATFEYGHRNLFGDAVSLSVHLQASYLPDFLILDPQVRRNYDTAWGSPAFAQRTATRDTITLGLPDIGLGPLIRAQVDGLAVRDLQRDFRLDKAALIYTTFFRPFRELQMSIAPDAELNDAYVFGEGTVEQYLEQQAAEGQGNADLNRLLRVPTGLSAAAAERFLVTWDRRDSAFNAHKGTLLAGGIEHVDWTSLVPATSRCPTAPRPAYDNALNTAANPGIAVQANGLPTTYNDASFTNPCEPGGGHFFRLTQTVAGYIPIGKKVTLAAELRTGFIFQTVGGTNSDGTPRSATYPDRLFFMGGFDSQRGYLQDTLMPQDLADRITADYKKPASDPTKFTQADVAVRGGNLMVNPRAELRFPFLPGGTIPFDGALFFDSGNLWSDTSHLFQHVAGGTGWEGFHLRTAVGVGIRIVTPIFPIALDFGLNTSRLFSPSDDPRRSYEDIGAVSFAIGLF